MPARLRVRPLLRHTVLAALCATAFPAAQALAAPVSIDLPAQPLGEALKAFARSAGVTVAADGALLTGKSAPALRACSSGGLAVGAQLA